MTRFIPSSDLSQNHSRYITDYFTFQDNSRIYSGLQILLIMRLTKKVGENVRRFTRRRFTHSMCDRGVMSNWSRAGDLVVP